MKRRRLTPRETAFLQRERVIRVATVGRDGTPWVVPVCHAVERGAIYFGSDKDGRKVRNIVKTKRVSLVADRYSDNWGRLRGVAVAGRGEILTRGPAFARAVRLLYRKYRQYEKVAALEPGESVIVRVRPSQVMSWNYAQ
ncbi:MAG TPA: pyridoxamine 5'-phosphate oxidase family protein [Methylomirabilota bacterium]|jgi:PPOX class probable F420-dependent enzyme|nr:pyridoxamine 5'-phosphate oxidase family protein [Methylomirabilota bacterium]